MYNINYVENLVSKEKYSSIILKLLKVINLLIHIAIIFILVLSFFSYEDLLDFGDRINTIKGSVLQKRGKYKINQIEKEWDYYYYRLTAIKELNDKGSKYSHIFKELGQYLPTGDFILNISSNDKGINFELCPDTERLRELSSFYDYAEVLDNYFAESSYLNKEFTVKNTKEERIGRKTLNILNVKI